MDFLMDWGNVAAKFDVLGILLTHPSRILPALAVVCLLIAQADRRMFSARLLVTVAVVFVAAWFMSTQSMDALLAPMAILLAGMAVWMVIAIIGAARKPSPRSNRFTKPAWLAFMATLLAATLASALEKAEVALSDGHPKVSESWLGILELTMFAVRESLWVMAGLGIVTTLTLCMLQWVQRPASGSGGHRTVSFC